MTPAELAAARTFRVSMRAELAKVQTGLTVSVYVRQYRHDCAKHGRSFFLELREHYVFSPAYVVEGSTVTESPDPDVGRGTARVIGTEFIEPRRFGWIFTRGRCPACGMTAVSSTGRLVYPDIRPPAEHAIVS